MRINCTKPVDRLSMDAAILVYLEQVVAPNVVFQLPESNSVPDEITNKAQKTTQVQQVYEIYKTRYQKQRNEQQEKQQSEKIHSENPNKKIAPEAVQKANDFDHLDCCRSEQYLLYSYDHTGCHSILGNEVAPGNYASLSIAGEFGRQA